VASSWLSEHAKALVGLRGGRPDRQPSPMPAYSTMCDEALVAGNTAAACAQGHRHIKLHETTSDAVRADQRLHPALGGKRIMLDVQLRVVAPTVPRDGGQASVAHGAWSRSQSAPPRKLWAGKGARLAAFPIAGRRKVAGLLASTQ